MFIAVVMSLILAACGSSDDETTTTAAAAGESTTTAAAEETTTTEASMEPVTIQLWHHFTPEVEQQAMQDLADRFHELHPNVTIEVTVVGSGDMATKTNTAMQANEPPDIFSGWGGASLGNYVDAGLVQDLTDELAVDGWVDEFLPGPLALYTLDGRSYGVPIRAGAWGLWIDKDLFAEAGIDGCPTLWSDFIDDVVALQDAGITPLAIGAKDQWTTAGWWEYLSIRAASADEVAATATLTNRTGSWTAEPFVLAGDMISELVALEPFQDGYQGASYDEQLSLAANGEVAMTFDGWWGTTWISSAGTDPEATIARLGFCPFPAIEGAPGDPTDVMGTGNGFSLGRDAPPEAVDFLRFITSPEEYPALVENGFAAPPVIVGMDSLVTDPNTIEIIELGGAAPHFNAEWNQSLGPEVGVVMVEQAAALINGATTGQAAAQAIEDAMQVAVGS